MNMIWDVRMLYVAVRRVRHLSQIAIVKTTKEPRYMGESLIHRAEKARQFGLERSAGNGAIKEYPIGDGRYIADLAVFKDGKLVKVIEVVVTSPPSREKLTYYEELGLECEAIILAKEPTPPAKEPTPPAKEPTPPAKGHSTTAYQPSMFSRNRTFMSTPGHFQALLQTNANGAARRFENSDLLDLYNFEILEWTDSRDPTEIHLK
ncbi:hypothetical protein T492DRAFT_1118021 [Pavlovales sp. CCMP2436]|nr:hypothetical protein T492DRAFT_1118021 [Pavlovales sp. CCMP2436]